MEHGVDMTWAPSEPLTSTHSANDALLRAITEEECDNHRGHCYHLRQVTLTSMAFFCLASTVLPLACCLHYLAHCCADFDFNALSVSHQPHSDQLTVCTSPDPVPTIPDINTLWLPARSFRAGCTDCCYSQEKRRRVTSFEENVSVSMTEHNIWSHSSSEMRVEIGQDQRTAQS